MSEITDKSDQVLVAAQEGTGVHLAEFCEHMAIRAKDLSPRDTGHNADSIDYETGVREARVYTQSGYGGFLEVGTARMAARPYFRPAFEQAKEAMS